MNAKHTLLKTVRCAMLFVIVGMIATGCATTRMADNNDPDDWLAQFEDDSWREACSEYSFIGF